VLRVLLHPDAVLHDVAQVAEYFLSSPLHMVHWLCKKPRRRRRARLNRHGRKLGVFPSYVYMLRLFLARLGCVAADAHALDLETGRGVVFHVALLAQFAAAATCTSAVLHGIHDEYRAYVRDCVLSPLRD
jgi:hypothetical protein